MRWQQLVIAGIVVATVALSAIAIYFWNLFAESLNAWLHRNRLEQSSLASVFIQVDRVFSAFRCKLLVTRKGSTKLQKVSEERLKPTNLPADVYQQLERVLRERKIFQETILTN